jgi:hypothetical protein
MLQSIVAAYLAAGGSVTRCRPGHARGRLTWGCVPHPTRAIPLSLGIVGRW